MSGPESKDAESEQPKLRKLIVRTVIMFAVALILYLGFSIYSGLEGLENAFVNVGIFQLSWMAGIVLLGWMLRGGRWLYFSHQRGWHVPAGTNLVAFCASFAFTATPGKMGELVKSWLLRDSHDVPMSETTGALLVERLQDLLAVLLLATFGLQLLDGGMAYFVTCLAILTVGTAFLLMPKLYRTVFGWLGRIKRLDKLSQKLTKLFESAHLLLKPQTFLTSFVIALFAWGGEGVVLHGILMALDVPSPLMTSFSLYGLATLVGALSMLPGGVGGFEAAMLLLLTSSFKTPQPVATAATLLIRALTLWFVNLLGFVFLLLWLRRPSR
jgi:uncharacterized protein (TIRG00374 family)